MQNSNENLSSVAKALRILKSFNVHHPVWRVGELSEELSFSKSTVSRLIQTLVAEDFLMEDKEEPGYRLGSALLYLGGNYINDSELYNEVSPVLNKLVLETGESAHIAVKNKKKVLYLNKQIGPYYSNIQTLTGSINPVHATSSGKALLAYSPEDVIEEIISDGLEAYTEHTITNPIQLRSELEKIRKLGYANSIEELAIGNFSISAPVFNYEGEIVCAISIVGPMSRLTKEKLTRFNRLIVRSAKEASERLGYDA